ncbi:THO complex subunit 2 [Marchantia polymorpha subsp. ruderalis]|uniref:THO complex subunit 2 n=2 Tax=Marchantia polymorpha TaxID=3197 RepID=A0AAF6AS82_MARPO|nr:hypothetical protein MARPO_0001s0369 [Marchantia polymorpha]BBM99302.1 hypothetical protein Mp_1g20320 [Marchantia polymorpha subsp. ruderalis]|eukprot:PTQ50383.1 hypothetical protein MARPO_0001s0369 [Marchantia polymorpha]
MAVLALECKYVTEEYVKEWKSNNSARKLSIEVPPARFVYELCWTVIRGELPQSKCRLALDAVGLTDHAAKEDTSSVLADTIAHMGQELTLPGESRTRLIELAKLLVQIDLVPMRLLQERCEAEFLWEAEMIRIKANELKSKEVRVNTRLLYQQTKFNLLREESEGYAKLLTLLCQRGPDGLTKQTSTAVVSTIKSLIGHFDLDPNRVFDIVLECFELQPDNSAFLELIPLFPKSHTSHILGFKFQYYQRTEVEDPVPTGLYRLAATLIKEDFIDLDSIYAHLLPKDEDALEQYEEISKRRIDEANKIGKINLAATGKDLMEEEKPGDVTIYLYAALDMETEAVAERSKELFTNQKLGLLNGFLVVDDWAHAHILFERLAALNPVAHPQICEGLSRAIEKAIAPYYATVRPGYLSKLNSRGKVHEAGPISVDPKLLTMGSASTASELQKEFFQMLSCIGPYLHRDVLLLQKVCRVLKGYYSSALAVVSSSSNSHDPQDLDRKDAKLALKEARFRVEEALGSCLLPSLQLLPANPAVGIEIWDVMSLLPYEARYRLYGEWEKEDERIPMVLAARQTAKLDTRRILKRLAKENLKQLGRMVAKIAHANPMTVLRTIVHQIEAYKDMIAPVVDAFKYLTQLEYDVLEYVVIERLAQGGREKLKEDGLNVSDWLQSLASFWGHLCKKYPSMELRGLFQYLVNQLKKGEGIELVLLQELIQQMASVEYTENVTEDQLEAMAGGETMRFQATAFGVTRNNKALMKSTNRLRDSLFSKDEPKLAVPLLLLIAQQRTNVVVNANAPYIKLVSEQFDRCHGTLLQYVEFLTSAVSPVSAYAQLIPPLDDLVHKYHIEPEVAFLIYRPVMRLFKPHKGSSTSWPADTYKSLVQVDGSKDSGASKISVDLVLDLGPNRKSLSWSDLLQTVQTILPQKAWQSLSPELYATFWGLTLHDLYVPKKRYETEMAKQRAALKILEENSDSSHAAVAKRKKDKEKIQEILDRLSAEMQKQEQNVTTVHQRLVREKDSWLTSCPDFLKTNMEFLQRCIFPRCVFSMMDAVYCARFVHTLHSLGTPYFNTVNHIDVLICKTLQPMISCCTEYEAGRLGRFLCETLKMAYHWKNEESTYERECGNMPGFAVLYRDPNSARVTFQQFVRQIHWKWSSRLTKLLVQCLESSDYMEIRNALTVLTKLSSVFPVTKKSGINLEKRVSKIKSDEREDLKVLAIGVAAALAHRKNSWVSDDDFTMGLLDIRPPSSPAKAAVGATSSGLVNSAAASEPSSTVTVGKSSGNPSVDAAMGTDMPNPPILPPIQAASVPAVVRHENTSAPPVKSEQPRGPSPASKPSTHNSVSEAKPAVVHLTSAPQASTRTSTTAPGRNGPEVAARAASGHVATTGVKVEEPSTKQPAKSVTADAEAARPPRRPSLSGPAGTGSVSSRSAKSESQRDDTTRAAPSSTSVQTSEASRGNENSGSRQRPSSAGTSSVVTNGSAGTTPAKSSSGRGVERSSQERARTSGDASTVRTDSGLKMDLSGIKVSDTKGSTDRERERERSEVQDVVVSQQYRPPSKSPRQEDNSVTTKIVEDSSSKERQGKRTVGSEETVDRLNKRRKSDGIEKTSEVGEPRTSERSDRVEQRPAERPRSVEHDRVGYDDRPFERPGERSDRGKERGGERVDREYRVAERMMERSERERGEEHTGDRFRDRSIEKFTRERSVDRGSDRVMDRNFDRAPDRIRDDRGKDDRGRPRYVDPQPAEPQPHPDDRFPMQNLPPPPPLPPNLVPLTVHPARREEEVDRRGRNPPRQTSSPRREEKNEKRRTEDVNLISIEDPKRRRDEELRDRKREERDLLQLKVEKEKEREKEKAFLAKEEGEGSAALSKRRRLKRDHIPSAELQANFGPSPPPPGVNAQVYEGRERDRKVVARNVYVEEGPYDNKGPGGGVGGGGGGGGRMHGKETKIARREHDQIYEREWEDDKRQRGDMKRHSHSRRK